MSWFENSTNRMIQHRLGTTYQMSLLLELFLALLSFVLLADRVSSMSFFFGIAAVLVAARIIFLYAVMSLGIETRIVYGIMLLLQALITTILFFTASIFISKKESTAKHRTTGGPSSAEARGSRSRERTITTCTFLRRNSPI